MVLSKILTFNHENITFSLTLKPVINKKFYAIKTDFLYSTIKINLKISQCLFKNSNKKSFKNKSKNQQIILKLVCFNDLQPKFDA